MAEHAGTFRWGKVVKASDDAGPYRILDIECDGKTIECHSLDLGALQLNPKAESLAFVITPDGDEGRAIALILPAPADRIDQLKEGETQFQQYKRGQFMKLDDSGNVIINAGTQSGDTQHVTPKGKHTITAMSDVLISGGSSVHLNPA